jgi:hypothetical protein
MSRHRCEVCSREFSYFEVVKAAWGKDKPVKCCNMRYRPAALSNIILTCAELIVMFSIFYMKFYMWLIVMPASLAVLAAVTPFITFLKAKPADEKPRSGKLYLFCKRMNWGAIIGAPLGLAADYVLRPSYRDGTTVSELILFEILPALAAGVIIDVIYSLVKLYRKKPDEPDENDPEYSVISKEWYQQ